MSNLSLQQSIRSGMVYWDREEQQYVRIEHSCPVCDRTVGQEFRLQMVCCDGCGIEVCQHLVGAYDDADFEVERVYCSDCAAQRSELGRLY